MKKAALLGMLAVSTVFVAHAQDAAAPTAPVAQNDEVEVSAEVAWMSAYVWRGQVYNANSVIQPQVTVDAYGFSFNVWGNYDIVENYNGNSSDFSEIDLTVAYHIPVGLDDFSFDVGAVNYSFPGMDVESVVEVYGRAALTTWEKYVTPSVTVYGGVSDADGVYVLFDVVSPWEISDYLGVNFGASAGWGSTQYNDDYFGGDQDAGWNDFNFYVTATYQIMDNLSVSCNLTYTFLDGGSIEEGANALYEDDHQLWGGINLAYDF